MTRCFYCEKTNLTARQAFHQRTCDEIWYITASWKGFLFVIFLKVTVTMLPFLQPVGCVWSGCFGWEGGGGGRRQHHLCSNVFALVWHKVFKMHSQQRAHNLFHVIRRRKNVRLKAEAMLNWGRWTDCAFIQNHEGWSLASVLQGSLGLLTGHKNKVRQNKLNRLFLYW